VVRGLFQPIWFVLVNGMKLLSWRNLSLSNKQ
jgi:hypothetical protein